MEQLTKVPEDFTLKSSVSLVESVFQEIYTNIHNEELYVIRKNEKILFMSCNKYAFQCALNLISFGNKPLEKLSDLSKVVPNRKQRRDKKYGKR